MKIYRYILLTIMFVYMTGCEKSNLTHDDLVGSWAATSSVFTSKADENEVIDVIEQGGDFSFTYLEDDKVRTWFTWDTISDEADFMAELSDDIITLTPAETERGISILQASYDGITLVLTNDNDSFDFTLSGAEETPAYSETFFERK